MAFSLYVLGLHFSMEFHFSDGQFNSPLLSCSWVIHNIPTSHMFYSSRRVRKHTQDRSKWRATFLDFKVSLPYTTERNATETQEFLV